LPVHCCCYLNQPLKSYSKYLLLSSGFAFLLLFFAACSAQKDTVTSRGMQNLTARYNILYNARELLKESEQNIQLASQDNFDVLITAFKEPNESLSQAEIKKMDDVILKANTIINDKSQSRYVDDAYFVIAKANFLKSNFYNATEFFSYIYSSYPKQLELKQASLGYKARALMNSDRFSEAEVTLDTAFKYLDAEKKSVADLYAVKAQLAIYGRKDEEAANLLAKAIENVGKGQNKIRWTYLLAQLQQLSGKREAALANFNKVVKSNAPFEMAFNARLSIISIQDEQTGRSVNREKQLLSLLRNDNNQDFADQIYFQIAESYANTGEMDKAIENYNTSIRRSTQNKNQKGTSYLALAEIYFKQADYLKSKAYFDSTLISLPPQYRDYDQIREKANSLELLANRLSIIATEDTLQMLAGLPETERQKRIDDLTRVKVPVANASQANPIYNQGSSGMVQSAFQNIGSEKFYFNNPIALSQGLSDFKRVWGNRKLEDNWRRSQKSLSNPELANSTGSEFVVPSNPDEAQAGPLGAVTSLGNSIPTTPEMLAESNQRILSAYYDIGNYYRESLNDDKEAIKAYETMLSRYPENNLKLPVYYNLYRLYATINPEKSQQYKNILLGKFPESPFAKVIRNPDYTRQTDEQETSLHQFYEQVYQKYVDRNYSEVLKLTAQAKQTFAENNLSPQLAYLHALALGHTQKLNVLDSAFRKIVTDFPEDKLVVPLVQQHLLYIDSNRLAMNTRRFALIDSDPYASRFVEEPEAAPVMTAQAPVTEPKAPLTNKEKEPEQTGVEPKPSSQTVLAAEKGLFTSTDPADYYFVVNVTDPSVNLSSSRFGIGQFNRANFSGTGIKHQLKSVNNQNQLIFVGAFKSREAAASYYENISPLMKEIMKMPASKYNTFFISKENLDRLNDPETITKYIEFYQQNFSRNE
jgi:tetratricopeptide (TPR) repeat protein